ncbi:MAG: phytanoyl-CoA dioxygenase family protein, partial [Alphaproteobacteria bacterium]
MKTLTSEQFAAFHDLGYLFPVRVMAAPDADSLRQRFEAFEAGDLVKQFAGREHELYRFKAHLLFTWVDRIVHNPRSLDIVEDIIGPNILVWTVGVFVKEPWSDYRVQWHQDSVHTGLDKPGLLMRGWHALTVSRPQNGTMRFLPHSHTLGDLPHISDSDSDGMKLRDAHVDYDIDESKAVSVDLAAGEVAFFSSRTLHE